MDATLEVALDEFLVSKMQQKLSRMKVGDDQFVGTKWLGQILCTVMVFADFGKRDLSWKSEELSAP